MTILEAIHRTDSTKPNSYTHAEKIRWLSTLDGIIKSEIMDTHEGGGEVVFDGYAEDTSMDTVLLVPAPYDELYLRYLEAQIDYANGEYGKYNNSHAAYNEAFLLYARYYNRTHRPKGAKFKFF